METQKIVIHLNSFSKDSRYGFMQDDKVCKLSLTGAEMQETVILSHDKAFAELKEVIKKVHEQLGEAMLDMIEDKSCVPAKNLL